MLALGQALRVICSVIGGWLVSRSTVRASKVDATLAVSCPAVPGACGTVTLVFTDSVVSSA
jgi:hypothetical protein